jgi:hypothetical protein
MRVLRLSGILLFLWAVCAGVTPAFAQAGDELRWRCSYDSVPAPLVACRPVQWPGPEALPVSLSGTLDRLPPLVKRIRMAPETLADERIVIPLYAPPIDMRFVARLARAVMCGSRPACEVDFSETPEED